MAKPELYDPALIDSADDTYFMNHGYKDTLKAMPDNVFLMTTGSRQPPTSTPSIASCPGAARCGRLPASR